MNEFGLSEKIYNTRMAGHIRRLHTKPENGEGQTVAAHTWGVTMILLDLFPDISRDTLIFVLRHDVPETKTGDIPAILKWANEDMAEIVAEMEDNFMEQMGWENESSLSLSDVLAFALADRIELLFYCLEQMYMGNWLLADVYVNVREKIMANLEQFKPEVKARGIEYINAYSNFLAEKFSKRAILSRDGLSIIKS